MAKAKKTAFFCQNCGYESSKMDGPVSGVQRMEHVCGGTDSGQNTGGKRRGSEITARRAESRCI